jgi:predicted ATPase
LLERQLEQLTTADQVLLAAASVAGMEFAVAAVAAVLAESVEDVEARCAVLTRRGQFLRGCGADAWPDGTVATRYGFLHALYREILYERVPSGRRARWHQQIGHRLEMGYGPQAREKAAELAEHFVRGRDTVRAVKHLHYAGEQAGQRSAHHEALQHLTQGLTLLATLPETPARAQQELDLQIALGLAWSATKGFAAPEVEQTYARARVLCAQVGETPQLFTTLWGLCRYYHGRGAFATARELGEQLWRVAERAADPTPRLDAHDTLGYNLFYLGDYTTAWGHLAQGITLIDPVAQQALVRHRGLAAGVMCLGVAANVLWCLGYPAQAAQRGQEGIALAQTLAHPYSLAAAQYWTIFLHYRRREAPAVQAQAETLITLATGQGFPLYRGFGTCWRGWALALQGHGAAGLEQMRQGLAAIAATGQTLSQQIYLVLLAEAAGHTGQVEEGLHLVTEAITMLGTSGRGDMLAEAYRVQGTLLLHQIVPETTRAEACFQQALALARHQQARSWALRAAISLSRLWQRQGKRKEAHQLLAPIYDWFTEGFDTADLQEAKALLENKTMRY